MSVDILDGKLLKNMLMGACENIRANLAEINDLNVFPVPDGDTGTNMTKTVEGGLSEVVNENSSKIGEVMGKFARGALLGARGNSGVILSQIFAGIKEELSKYDEVTALDLSKAYKSGVTKAYSSVSNPTEGTILTVFRESTEYASKNISEKSSIEDFYRLHIEEAKRSLLRTKEILPVLAEADVVDSGAAGYLCITIGMYSALTGEYKAEFYSFTESASAPKLDFERFSRDSEMKYGYCTEFLLRLTTNKVEPDSFSSDTIVDELKQMGGESIVAYKEGDVVKVHVHTLTPGKALELAQKYGEFLTVKIENMELGHSDTESVKKKTKKKKLATVAVATGEGICALFKDMGADGIVSGGQTANPSTEEFIAIFKEMNAESIIVLPNNKNVMLAAKQAQEMYTDSKVYIVPTYTLMEGYAALSVITPAITDMDVLCDNATRAAKGIVGSEITRAVRDVTIDGKEIKKGNYIAITDGKITACGEGREDVLYSMLEGVEDIEDYEIITLFVGRDVDENARCTIVDALEEKYPEHEIVCYEGKQELYDFLVAIE